MNFKLIVALQSNAFASLSRHQDTIQLATYLINSCERFKGNEHKYLTFNVSDLLQLIVIHSHMYNLIAPTFQSKSFYFLIP